MSDADENPRTGKDWIEIKPAPFAMGAEPAPDCLEKYNVDYAGPHWDEAPVHDVTLSYSFAIAVRPVNNAAFAEFRPEHRSEMESRGETWEPDAPATLVTWRDAAEYCDWRSAATGEPIRLPTEAEWEFAAREKPEFESGLADGAFHEWCLDWWGDYPNAPRRDPVGPVSGDTRVIRGGRTTNRGSSFPDDRRPELGFRLVRAPLPDSNPDPLPEAPAVFREVSENKKIWEPSVDPETPFFEGGTEYITPPSEPLRLPYWHRHHVPSVVWCDNGDLLATCFTAPHDAHEQMAILVTRRRDGRSEWDPPARFCLASDRNTTSAALHRAPDGTIHHYNGLNGFGDARVGHFSMLKRISRDNGATWSEYKLVHEYPAQKASMETFTGEPRLWPHMDLVRLDENTLIMPTDVGGGHDRGSAVFISRDDGDSWSELTRFGWNHENFAKAGGQAGWIAGIHAPFVILKDGRYLAFGRTNDIDGKAPKSVSSDGGRSWTYQASEFPQLRSSQRPVLKRLAEGPLLLVTFTGHKKVDQEPLEVLDATGKSCRVLGAFAALSFDEGETWPIKKLIPQSLDTPDEADPAGYLSCVQTPDDMIHLISSKRHYRFNLAWIKQHGETNAD